jgi:RNA polymerase sigma-70 factor (ECF subfamily)
MGGADRRRPDRSVAEGENGMKVEVAEREALQALDGDLVMRHRYGDVAAFEKVHALHERMVYNLALRLLGDPEEAADLSQEAFLRVYRHLHRFRGRSSLRTWIYRVTLNCCRSRLERRKRGAMVWTEAAPGSVESVPDPRRGPEEKALASAAGDRVAAALSRLPSEFREAVVLRDLEGLSYREIATITGRRIGTIRSRIARGRERMRDLLLEGEL